MRSRGRAWAALAVGAIALLTVIPQAAAEEADSPAETKLHIAIEPYGTFGPGPHDAVVQAVITCTNSISLSVVGDFEQAGVRGSHRFTTSAQSQWCRPDAPIRAFIPARTVTGSGSFGAGPATVWLFVRGWDRFDSPFQQRPSALATRQVTLIDGVALERYILGRVEAGDTALEAAVREAIVTRLWQAPLPAEQEAKCIKEVRAAGGDVKALRAPGTTFLFGAEGVDIVDHPIQQDEVFCGFGGNDRVQDGPNWDGFGLGDATVFGTFVGGEGYDHVAKVAPGGTTYGVNVKENLGVAYGGRFMYGPGTIGHDRIEVNGANGVVRGDVEVGDNYGQVFGGMGTTVVSRNLNVFHGGAGDDRVVQNHRDFYGEDGDDAITGFFRRGLFHGGAGFDSVAAVSGDRPRTCISVEAGC